MPIYEYTCQACGHGLEALQKMSDAPLTDCPECGRPDLRKMVSAAGFVLKGGGWYVTDFRDKGKKGAPSAGGEEGSSGKKEAQQGDAAGVTATGGKDATPAATDSSTD